MVDCGLLDLEWLVDSCLDLLAGRLEERLADSLRLDDSGPLPLEEDLREDGREDGRSPPRSTVVLRLDTLGTPPRRGRRGLLLSTSSLARLDSVPTEWMRLISPMVLDLLAWD